MSLALQCLVGLHLLVFGATAALPALWLSREPRPRPMAGTPEQAGAPLWIVRAADRRWFRNGQPISAAALTAELRGLGPGRRVRFLPSSALPIEAVSVSLRWLRRQGQAPVLLELPEGR